jgi:Fe-S cluster assembly protein SufD
MSAWAAQLATGLPDTAAKGDWPALLRISGARAFDRHGVPGTHIEQWKYTSLRALEQRQPALGAAAGAADGPVPSPVVEAALCLHLHDGDFISAKGEIPAGLRVQSLGVALHDQVPGLRALLESLDLEQGWQGLSALNTATLRSGLVLHVDAGVDAGEVLVQWTGSAATEQLFNTRVCVLLGEGARMGLLEQFEDSAATSSLLNGVWQFELAQHAQLRHARIQRLAPESMLLSRTEARQAAASRYHFSTLDLGAGLARHDVRAVLNGPGATCALDAASVTSGRSHTDHHFEAAHLAGACRSSQLYRAMASERGRAVFNGKVHIAEGADGSESRQSCAGLLLSPLAEIDAKPELEIYADEVVASHGATVGQLDEQALFYLQSRGLDPTAARALLTMAFGRVVSDHLPVAAWRDALGDCLQQRMDGLGAAGG